MHNTYFVSFVICALCAPTTIAASLYYDQRYQAIVTNASTIATNLSSVISDINIATFQQNYTAAAPLDRLTEKGIKQYVLDYTALIKEYGDGSVAFFNRDAPAVSSAMGQYIQACSGWDAMQQRYQQLKPLLDALKQYVYTINTTNLVSRLQTQTTTVSIAEVESIKTLQTTIDTNLIPSVLAGASPSTVSDFQLNSRYSDYQGAVSFLTPGLTTFNKTYIAATTATSYAFDWNRFAKPTSPDNTSVAGYIQLTSPVQNDRAHALIALGTTTGERRYVLTIIAATDSLVVYLDKFDTTKPLDGNRKGMMILKAAADIAAALRSQQIVYFTFSVASDTGNKKAFSLEMGTSKTTLRTLWGYFDDVAWSPLGTVAFSAWQTPLIMRLEQYTSTTVTSIKPKIAPLLSDALSPLLQSFNATASGLVTTLLGDIEKLSFPAEHATSYTNLLNQKTISIDPLATDASISFLASTPAAALYTMFTQLLTQLSTTKKSWDDYQSDPLIGRIATFITTASTAMAAAQSEISKTSFTSDPTRTLATEQDAIKTQLATKGTLSTALSQMQAKFNDTNTQIQTQSTAWNAARQKIIAQLNMKINAYLDQANQGLNTLKTNPWQWDAQNNTYFFEAKCNAADGSSGEIDSIIQNQLGGIAALTDVSSVQTYQQTKQALIAARAQFNTAKQTAQTIETKFTALLDQYIASYGSTEPKLTNALQTSVFSNIAAYQELTARLSQQQTLDLLPTESGGEAFIPATLSPKYVTYKQQKTTDINTKTAWDNGRIALEKALSQKYTTYTTQADALVAALTQDIQTKTFTTNRQPALDALTQLVTDSNTLVNNLGGSTALSIPLQNAAAAFLIKKKQVSDALASWQTAPLVGRIETFNTRAQSVLDRLSAEIANRTFTEPVGQEASDYRLDQLTLKPSAILLEKQDLETQFQKLDTATQTSLQTSYQRIQQLTKDIVTAWGTWSGLKSTTTGFSTELASYITAANTLQNKITADTTLTNESISEVFATLQKQEQGIAIILNTTLGGVDRLSTESKTHYTQYTTTQTTTHAAYEAWQAASAKAAADAKAAAEAQAASAEKIEKTKIAIAAYVTAAQKLIDVGVTDYRSLMVSNAYDASATQNILKLQATADALYAILTSEEKQSVTTQFAMLSKLAQTIKSNTEQWKTSRTNYEQEQQQLQQKLSVLTNTLSDYIAAAQALTLQPLSAPTAYDETALKLLSDKRAATDIALAAVGGFDGLKQLSTNTVEVATIVSHQQFYETYNQKIESTKQAWATSVKAAADAAQITAKLNEYTSAAHTCITALSGDTTFTLQPDAQIADLNAQHTAIAALLSTMGGSSSLSGNLQQLYAQHIELAASVTTTLNSWSTARLEFEKAKLDAEAKAQAEAAAKAKAEAEAQAKLDAEKAAQEKAAADAKAAEEAQDAAVNTAAAVTTPAPVTTQAETPTNEQALVATAPANPTPQIAIKNNTFSFTIQSTDGITLEIRDNENKAHTMRINATHTAPENNRLTLLVDVTRYSVGSVLQPFMLLKENEYISWSDITLPSDAMPHTFTITAELQPPTNGTGDGQLTFTLNRAAFGSTPAKSAQLTEAFAVTQNTEFMLSWYRLSNTKTGSSFTLFQEESATQQTPAIAPAQKIIARDVAQVGNVQARSSR